MEAKPKLWLVIAVVPFVVPEAATAPADILPGFQQQVFSESGWGCCIVYAD